MLSALLPLADPQATFGIVSFGPKADMERSITGGAPLASNTNGAARRAVKVGREVAVLRAFSQITEPRLPTILPTTANSATIR